jgi:hypothetical protein
VLSRSNLTYFSTTSRRPSQPRLVRLDEDGTRTLGWAFEHQRLRLRAPILVCQSLDFRGIENGISIDRERVLNRVPSSKSPCQTEILMARKCYNNGANSGSHRQEVPIHRHGFHSWPYLDRHGCLHQDAPHNHHPSRIPSLYPQIR